MSPTTSATTVARPARDFDGATKTSPDAPPRDADVLHFPDGKPIIPSSETNEAPSLEEMKTAYPEFAKNAEKFYPKSAKGQTQFMIQSIQQAEAIARREAEGDKADHSLLRQAQQAAFDYSTDHKKTAAAQERNGVGGIFSTAFAHIPVSSPYRPK